MIEILGYIFLFILTVIATFFAYHVLRGAIIGASLMRWQMKGANWTVIRNTKGWPLKLVGLYLNCWLECIFYNGSITYSRGTDRWEGFGTGR